MKKNLLSLFTVAILFTARAFSFVIAVPGKNLTIDSNRPAHIIVVGKGADMGLGFLASAHLIVKKYVALYPEHQVIIFSVNEGDDASAPYLTKLNYSIVTEENDNLSMKNIVKAIKKYNIPSLESLDVIAHNFPTFGSVLENKRNRMSPSNDRLEGVSHLFSETFYIKLHGCNTGFVVAPAQANSLGVLVIGSLTSTSLTRPYSDGFWYYADPKLSPVEQVWSPSLLLSEDKATSCKGPMCYRLMPVKSAYNGYWGSLDGGLPYYKAFCPVGKEARCKKAMARSLINLVGNNSQLNKNRSLENITLALQDLMCSSSTVIERKNECLQNVSDVVNKKSNRFRPIWAGKNIKCDLNDCEAQLKCDKILGLVPKPGTCYLENSSDDKNLKTGVTEIEGYLEGFNNLEN